HHFRDRPRGHPPGTTMRQRPSPNESAASSVANVPVGLDTASRTKRAERIVLHPWLSYLRRRNNEGFAQFLHPGAGTSLADAVLRPDCPVHDPRKHVQSGPVTAREDSSWSPRARSRLWNRHPGVAG